MNKISRRDTIALVVAALIIILIPVLALTLNKPIENKNTARYNAEISLASGQVEKSENIGTWVVVKANETVSQNDTVRVLGEGKAIITLDDGSAVRLNSDSIARFTSLDPRNIEILNESGEIYTRVIKADRSFVVKVDDESYEAMGTAYKTINSKDVKGVLVYENKVKAKKDSLEVPEGKKLYKKNESQQGFVNKVIDMQAEEIEKDSFAQWNKEEDLKKEEFKQYLGVLSTKKPVEAPVDPTTPKTNTTIPVPKVVTPTNPVAGITLAGIATSAGIDLKWTTTGVDTSKGFKLVKNTAPNPVYPGNSAAYINAGSSAYSMNLTDGKTYHFRICQYTGGGCGVYSNDITVTAPKVADGVVSKIELFAYSAAQVKWYITGLSDLGVKVVWSKTSAPTYPTRTGDKYHYYSDQSLYKIDTLDAFDGPGIYYVRVCEYLGGSCGVYSNEVQINL